MKKNNNYVFKVLMLWAMSAVVDAEDELLQFNSLPPSLTVHAKTEQTTVPQVNTAQTEQAAKHKAVKTAFHAQHSQRRVISNQSTDSNTTHQEKKHSETKWVPRKRVKQAFSSTTEAANRDAKQILSKTVTRREPTGVDAAHESVPTRPITATKATEKWVPRKRLTSSRVHDEPAVNSFDAKVAPVVPEMAIASKQKLHQASSTATTTSAQPVKASVKLKYNRSVAESVPVPAVAQIVEKPTDSKGAVSKLKIIDTKSNHSLTFINVYPPKHGNAVAISSQSASESLGTAAERKTLDKPQPKDLKSTTSRGAETLRAAAAAAARPIVTDKPLPAAEVSSAEPTAVTSTSYQGIADNSLKTSHTKPAGIAKKGLAKANLAITAGGQAEYSTSSRAINSPYLQQHLPAESQVTKPKLTSSTVSGLANAKVKPIAVSNSATGGHQLAASSHHSQTVVKTRLQGSTTDRSTSPNTKPFSSISVGEKLRKVIVIATPQSLEGGHRQGGSDLKGLLAINNTDSDSDKPHVEQITVTNYAINTRDFLRQVIQESMNYSPEIKGQQANSIAAGYDADQVKGQRWPQISVGAATPMKSIGSGNRNTSSSLSDSFATVNATTNIYDFGMTSAKIDAAENTQKSLNYTLTLTRNQIAGQLLKQILQLRQYQEQLAVAKKFHARMSKLTDMMSQIVDKDPGRGSELVQARAKLLEANTNIRNTENSLENTQIAIMRLIGHRLTLPIGLDFSHIDMSKDQIASALKMHPKLLADKEDYDAAKNRTKAADAEKYPRINWVVSKSTEKDEDGHQDAWQTGVQLQWNLFSGGSTVASVKAAASRASASKMQLSTDRLEIENQIQNLLFQKTSSQVRSKDYQKLIKETDKVSQMFYEQWYYLGKRSLLDVLTSETDHFNQQLAEIQIRYEGYQASTGLLVQTVSLLPWVGLKL